MSGCRPKENANIVGPCWPVPTPPTSPKYPSRQRRIFAPSSEADPIPLSFATGPSHIGNDDDDEVFDPAESPTPMSVNLGPESDSFFAAEQPEDEDEDVGEPDLHSDEEEGFESENEDEDLIPEDSDGEDSDNDADIFDWDSFIPPNAGLAAWDKLGAEYEAEAATAHKLSEYDLAICRAFSFKVQANMTDRAFKMAPHAFPQTPPLPKLDALRARINFLAGFKPEIYDCCPNSCLNLVSEPTAKARKKFTYIPVIPRLVAFAANREIAEKRQYRAQHQHTRGSTSDVFDGAHYRSLLGRFVEMAGKTYPHKYFSDPRDVALGASWDGFASFKRRKKTAWPLILFDYDLPPEIRFHLAFILALGVIPGPNKPKDSDSFLYPFTAFNPIVDRAWPTLAYLGLPSVYLCLPGYTYVYHSKYTEELLRLAAGVRAFDILTGEIFALRAYLILVFGDIPAVSMFMRMKGHNGFSPCRMCKIIGLRIPNSRNTTHYVPLDRSCHPSVAADASAVHVYDGGNLPMRTQSEIISQGRPVESAPTTAASERLAKSTGVKGVSILSHLGSLSFPGSFPYDFMHLIWENLLKNLILLWTGEFKGLDAGREDYELSKTVWEAIGVRTASAFDTIPRQMWSFWAIYLGPVLLRRRFKKAKYFTHFIELVRLLNICLQFEISDDEIEEVRVGFINWVRVYEDIYFQYDPDRLSTCPLTVHALLHIAPSIKFCGPVWCYWAFPMERFCGSIQPGIRSRRFPWASMDRYVFELAQLTQIKTVYNLGAELSLRDPPTQT
ncbi:hypothetical protein MSAN_00303900 [Mycena sanguinolenta]|uniref:Transposase family Tnp2 protein n=1 Tax=Mycena sanguinolenta TaxID=230812 RepID=A0A8H7DK49_9AGAR|nr:hypothetical protein MSAN_00303900 [Mycena sanguinolenta]